MTGFDLQAWHVSLFTAGAILILEVIVWAVLRMRAQDRPVGDGEQDRLSRKRLRTVGLVLLAIIALVMAVAALGPDLADKLAGVTAAALAGVGVWLAYRSHQETVRLAAEIRAAARTTPAASPADPAAAVSASASSAQPASAGRSAPHDSSAQPASAGRSAHPDSSARPASAVSPAHPVSSAPADSPAGADPVARRDQPGQPG